MSFIARSEKRIGGCQSVMGIDPGLQRTGFAVVAAAPQPQEARLLEAGVIRLSRGQDIAQRLVELAEGLATLLAAHRPGMLCCEELYAHYKHPRTAILMGHARGVILATAAQAGLEIFPVAATHVKKLLTGSGRAGKRQVQLAVAGTLHLPTVPEPNDVADAIAIGLAGLRLRALRAVADAASRRAAK